MEWIRLDTVVDVARGMMFMVSVTFGLVNRLPELRSSIDGNQSESPTVPAYAN
jgi:hypothetical protein